MNDALRTRLQGATFDMVNGDVALQLVYALIDGLRGYDPQLDARLSQALKARSDLIDVAGGGDAARAAIYTSAMLMALQAEFEEKAHPSITAIGQPAPQLSSLACAHWPMPGKAGADL